MTDKRLLDVADHARRERLTQIAEPMPPTPRPSVTAPDGRTFHYTGPWDGLADERARLAEVDYLETMELRSLIVFHAHVHARVQAYLAENGPL